MTTVTRKPMTQDELIDHLRQAQEYMQTACTFIGDYIRQTDDQNAKAYILDPLMILTSRDHGFLTKDISVDTLIDRVEDLEIE